MRFGDHNRGAVISRRGRRIFIEWWWQSDRYRVRQFGPFVFVELPW